MKIFIKFWVSLLFSQLIKSFFLNSNQFQVSAYFITVDETKFHLVKVKKII